MLDLFQSKCKNTHAFKVAFWCTHVTGNHFRIHDASVPYFQNGSLLSYPMKTPRSIKLGPPSNVIESHLFGGCSHISRWCMVWKTSSNYGGTNGTFLFLLWCSAHWCSHSTTTRPSFLCSNCLVSQCCSWRWFRNNRPDLEHCKESACNISIIKTPIGFHLGLLLIAYKKND